MLSTVPAFSFSEPGLVNQFSDFQTGFTPWEWNNSSDLFFSVNQLSHEPVVPSPCYGESDIGLVDIKPGSDKYVAGFDEARTPHGLPCSKPVVPSPCHGESGSVRINTGLDKIKPGSDKICDAFIKTKPDFDDADTPHGLDIANFGKPSEPEEITEERERKRKRKESNRESARRSRKRRQSHIDNLRNEVNRLDLENRELGNRLRLVLYQLQRVNTDNNRLVTEQEILRFRLSELRQILILRQQWEELHNRRIIMNDQMR